MKKNNWHKLFNKKNFGYNTKSKKVSLRPYDLTKVIFINLTRKRFKKITFFFQKKINLKKNENLLDFGSGNGSFLLYFQKKAKKLYSIEISKPLINFQRKFLKRTKFISANPNDVNFFKKIKNNEVDITIANSVFQYFKSEKYCKDVLTEMIRVTKKVIFIYDIKDKSKQRLYFDNARKKQNLTLKEFKKKYKLTPLRCYNKLFFKEFISSKFPKKKVRFFDLPKAQEDNKFGYCLKIS